MVDASVGVKWFSPKDETALRQAVAIRNAHMAEEVLIIVPDLFYYEVANAIVRKEFFSSDMLQSAVSALFALGLRTARIEGSLLGNAVDISRRYNITVYDSCYVVIAQDYGCPLVTANPRHQGRALGCEVVPIEEWHG
ncbi:MAG: hypothetical protein A2147_09755 [Chloroflexi bacterium RBG_16_57_8]|nr:MAG: hypothetical protein A2147_09755 [Chloroflexi bacterium RBG_16_57_8]